ncbi:MAG: right-handed parallel beta-helix repeat-containing protein [Planctomycetes bacterium]|nr:right-handed parallel beta-helix repeat-containing protein [Planctomycetota bacterium]MCH9725843.1 right-handed parallel beta-helix repeat-containing protein [Planctomycetota bacterium]MCH9775407.1 right-handed parallel beta-helix repeat-containing protein [Planctomycetota bacterium]MCH9790272.1 right-handed parallel beta-helix repeat-containing protein [Planctomycetota bacterium]
MLFLLPLQSSAQDPEWLEEEDYLYRAYFDFSGAAGSHRETGQGLLFVPLAQDGESLFFADLRGNIFDNSSAEGNFGLAYRRMVNDQWIAGLYGFFDVRRSEYDNIFKQGSFGFELLSIEWDFRVNGYVPTLKQKRVDSLSTAYLSGNNIVVQGGEERAYWGTDFEIGRLLKTFEEFDVDAELRGYVGGYYFDNSAPGFKEMAGTRLRAEFRMFDLPFLGNGSRVVLAGQYQYDELRGSQGTGMVTIRVPLPGNGDSQRLNRFQRRMVTPIVRDIDIVLNQARGPVEQAKLQQTGQVLNNITIIDANTASAESVFNGAGADSVVLFDGSAGTINTSSGFVFNNGQLALAGGKTVNVIGCDSGAITGFNYGSTPTVNGTVNSIDVFTMANNSTLMGMNITGGQNGVFGNNISGFTMACNTISGALEDGAHLDGDINGTIIDNTFDGNGTTTDNDGLQIENFVGGSITGNTFKNNAYGFYVANEISGGTISKNTAHNNMYDGFYITDMSDGTISNNTSRDNGEDGYYFDNTISGGVFSNNIASNNGNFGFNLYEMTGGTISGNQALDNDYAGFAFFGNITGGTFSGNIANTNDDGFYFDQDVTGGTFSGNSASNNRFNGFYFNDDVSNMTFTGNVATGNESNGIKFGDTVGPGTLISNNSAINNEDDGFDFEDVAGGTISNNLASGNLEDGFDFDDFFVGGTFSNNTSIGNTFNGYDFIAPIVGGTISDNSARNNSADGFFVNIFGGGNTATFSNNSATQNTSNGYNVLTGAPQTGTGTNTGSGNGSNNNY